MQSAVFNLQYAQAIPALSSSLAAIPIPSSAGELTVDQENSVRELLISNDSYDFGSAAWFLTSQCPQSVRSGLQSGSLAGWQDYVSVCIGTVLVPERETYWHKACQTLGVGK